MDSALRESLRAQIDDHAEVKAAWVFGSVARGVDRPDSDVDIAVFFDRRQRPETLDDLPLGLEADLASEVHREVQVVVVDWAPVDLVHRVLRDGLLLIDRDRSARIRFEVDARNRYFDLLPVLRRYRRQAS